jgi:pyridoxal phosphate enzyme (YggS family)
VEQLSLQERIALVQRRIAKACARSGRPIEDVNTIAVTKYVSVEAAQEVIAKGYIRIGENRWQDAKAKWEVIGNEAEWHFIGHLQTNKVKEVVGRFPYVHSLDRLSLAEELSRKASAAGLEVKCFIQLNISGEETKDGLAPEQLIPFAERIRTMPGIRIVGLMTMAPYEADPESTRPVFRGLREWRDRLNASNVLPDKVPHLSMGMSNDFEIAIEEGATWIRLGSILVGKEK